MKSTQIEYLRPARAEDVQDLMALRTEAETWLGTKGTDQWSHAETGAKAITKWRASIDEGRAWVVVDGGGGVLATVSRGPVDRDFWVDEDRPESALYLYKLIVARRAAGRQLGARLVDWASTLAAMEGRDWVRIDTWRTNGGLHAYYERLGFEHVRTESPSHRRSGWLAQRSVAALSLPEVPLRAGMRRVEAAIALPSPGRRH
ncbi:GNAT family N-acetyltransferase [Streptomyces sp. NPDC050507]|uniref:GNAT family N-acetyltransferase n=1 Tax=Streptomyces sp. NPDC050507 TaxID=3365619 RepID=UPI003796E6CC